MYFEINETSGPVGMLYCCDPRRTSVGCMVKVSGKPNKFREVLMLTFLFITSPRYESCCIS